MLTPCGVIYLHTINDQKPTASPQPNVASVQVPMPMPISLKALQFEGKVAPAFWQACFEQGIPSGLVKLEHHLHPKQ
jgi:hypothetical protein